MTEHVWVLKWVNDEDPDDNKITVYSHKFKASAAMTELDREFVKEPRDVKLDRREWGDGIGLKAFGITYELGDDPDTVQMFEATVEPYEVF